MIYAIAAVLVLILDQGLKYFVTVNITLDTGAVHLIPGVLDLVNIHNTGAAFGILQGGGWRWIFVVIALLFVAIAVYAIRRGLIKGAVGRWAVVGVLAGAIGNCIDRVLFGYVVDMFQPVFLQDTPFGAIFNVADMFISCCGILFCIYILFSREYKTPKQAAAEEEGAKPRARRAGSRTHTGGSHAKGSGSSRRVPAREAAKANVERAARQQPAPAQRTRIPVQQPRPQRRPAQAARSATPVDPANPFAEWENAPKAAPAQAAPEKEEGYAYYLTPNYDPEPAAKPDAAAGAAKARPEAGHEFTLEEILAEFSDK